MNVNFEKGKCHLNSQKAEISSNRIRLSYRVIRSRLKERNTKISPEHVLDKLCRIQHQVVKVSDLEPIAGLSSIKQEHTEILQAPTIKNPTLPAQLTLL